MWIIALVWVVNFVISWWNAKVTGLVWVESKMMGGFTRFMTWMGAIMAACGFSWCILIILALVAHGIVPKYFTAKAMEASLNLGYLILVPVIIFSGLMIWIESLVIAWRQRDLPSVAVATWNTFAQIHNTYSAIEGMSGAWKVVSEFFSDMLEDTDDFAGWISIIVISIVISSISAGILLTYMIIKNYAGTVPLPVRD